MTPHCHRLIFLLLLLAGCDLARPATAPAGRPTRLVPTLFPTAPHIAAPTPAGGLFDPATPAPDTGWVAGPSGLELRRLRVAEESDQAAASLTVVRIDPARVRLRVAYAPDTPRAMRSWFTAGRPLAAINGSFFDERYRATALLISDRAVSGASYQGFGGMLAVAPDGGVSIRPLRDEPYDSGEPLAQALQSFPMLVFPGGAVAPIDDDGQHARRSAIAIDRSGRLLLIACATGSFTLRGLADWLSRSDLAIDRALNLDGGSSTGLFVHDGALREEIDSLGPLPIVLLVEGKQLPAHPAPVISRRVKAR